LLLTIHQPENLPWLGYFHKMAVADLYVILASVQFEKNNFQNRNKIRAKSPSGWQWVTTPVLTKGRSGQQINKVEINQTDRRRTEKLWISLSQSYQEAPYFELLRDPLKAIISQADLTNLTELNMQLISLMRERLGIETPIVMASELGFTSHRSELLAEISNELNADTYLSGPSGRDYLDITEFEKRNIKVDYHEFHHPTYSQIHGDFLPYMSTIDLIFNHGPNAREILLGQS
jgi:hypothetical protein